MTTQKRKPDFKPHMYEQQTWAQSELVCGIDEVGRSCLAGPVVAAAALLKPYAHHPLLKDSKLLSAQQRAIVYSWLIDNSTFGVGIIHHRIVDRLNIYQATLVAMKRAVMQVLALVPQKPRLIVVDTMPLLIEPIDIPVIYFCHGEQQSASIAAASIIAKVTRDALISRLDGTFTGYSFLSNKGYGTRVHKNSLFEKGTCLLHRYSFLKFLRVCATEKTQNSSI